MAIIKNNGIKCLGQFDGVIVYIESAINKMFIDGEEKEVVTGICFKDLDGNILYEQNNYNNYICLLESDSRYFNLNDIIHELALYVQHCKIEKYFKDIIISNILNNNPTSKIALKKFVAEYYSNIESEIKRKKAEQCKKEIENIKENIKEVVKDINNYTTMKICEPDYNNRYKLQFVTKNTLKEFNTIDIYYNIEGVEKYRNILKWINEYLYCISNDFDPIYFLKFDKVI